MNLKDYIRKHHGVGRQLAKKIGVTPIYLSQMTSGYRPVSPINALAIERATQGQVSRRDLRPDDWHLIWSDL